MKNKINNKILIIGAGEAGQMLLSEYEKRGRIQSIVGFIDDDISKEKSIKFEKKILGAIDEITFILRNNCIEQVVIAMPSVKSVIINKIISEIISYKTDLNIYILPSIEKYFKSVPLLSSLENISFQDIFNREEVEIDVDVIKEVYSNKTILITGAGGSIGSEICRQLLKFDVDKIIALGRGEFSIYNLIRSMNSFLESMEKKPEVIYKIANVKDYDMLDKIFEEEKPDVIFHAAAHKHVPLMEFNESEAVHNNVLGTKNVLELSVKHNIEKFVMVSTDKAVRPTNIMGTTKRLAEIITDYYHTEKGLNTTIVRFGNVIGSRGSVIPLFREQIERGGPVTVTHREITRYFMSIPEASILVINASALNLDGKVFVLDMGEQYKVIDIAKRLIELYGFKPEIDIAIEYTGLRPGEKMYEELFYDKSNMVGTENNKIFVLNRTTNSYNIDRLEGFLEKELVNIMKMNGEEVRVILKELVPEYEYEFKKEKIDSGKLIS